MKEKQAIEEAASHSAKENGAFMGNMEIPLQKKKKLKQLPTAVGFEQHLL